MPEFDDVDRRDSSRDITDIKVAIGRIETLVSTQGVTLTQMQNKLELGVFREEYERRHKELEALTATALKTAGAAESDNAVLRGQIRVWRYVSGSAIALLTVASGILYFAKP